VAQSPISYWTLSMRNPFRCCEQAVGSSKVSCHENSFEPSKGPENIELVVLSIGLWSIDLTPRKTFYVDSKPRIGSVGL
jgi:hypothetical protein